MLGKVYKLCILEKNEDDTYLRFIPLANKTPFQNCYQTHRGCQQHWWDIKFLSPFFSQNSRGAPYPSMPSRTSLSNEWHATLYFVVSYLPNTITSNLGALPTKQTDNLIYFHNNPVSLEILHKFQQTVIWQLQPFEPYNQLSLEIIQVLFECPRAKVWRCRGRAAVCLHTLIICCWQHVLGCICLHDGVISRG